MSSSGEVELVQILRALGDPRRFRMVRVLAEAGELSCGELGSRFALSQPTVSHHLKILVDAGVVLARQAGQHHFLSIDRELLARLAVRIPEQLAPQVRRSSKRSRSTTGRPAA